MAITSVGLILVKCMQNRTMKSKTVNCIDFQVIIGLGCNKEVTFIWIISFLLLKALANEDTLLPTHCCRLKCFPVCPRAQHLLRTQILCAGHKNVSDFVQKHFVSATNVFQFGQPKKDHRQQCVLVYQGL